MAVGAMTDSSRRTHPLLGVFPLAVMTLATFLVLFTVMTARLRAGADPALNASRPPALLAERSGAGAVRTRVSGGVSVAAATTSAAAQTPVGTVSVVTRASGAAGAQGAGDE